MSRPQKRLLTDKEMEIMNSLWERNKATSEEIRHDLPGNPHDSSIRTMLRILVTKGYVEIVPDSRPAIYKPLMKRLRFQKKAAKELVKKVFGGSAQELVMQLLQESEISPDELKELEKRYRRKPEGK